jgi:hypothetical protein
VQIDERHVGGGATDDFQLGLEQRSLLTIFRRFVRLRLEQPNQRAR